MENFVQSPISEILSTWRKDSWVLFSYGGFPSPVGAGAYKSGGAVHLSTELLSLNAERTKRPPWSPPSTADVLLRVLPRKDEMRRKKKVIRESGISPEKWTSYKNENGKLKAQSGLKFVQVLGKEMC
jgi:hypothetical protein